MCPCALRVRGLNAKVRKRRRRDASDGTMPAKGFQVLLIEDNAGDATLLKAFLAQSPIHFAVKHAVAFEGAAEEMAREKPDAVLLDLGLPDSRGLETLAQTRKFAPNTPVVVLTGLKDTELALQALQEGAQDYLVKGTVESQSLVQSLRYAIERQRLQAETEQLRLQQIALKDDFLSHVSHELRSPLNAIYQFVSILSDGLAGECNPQQREYLQIISRNAGQLQSMIGELLDVTRAGAGKLSVDPQLTEIPGRVEEAVQTVQSAAAAKGVSLSTEVPAKLPPAYADPDRVRQILVNLLENAVKYTQQGGRVMLSVSAVTTPPALPMLQFSVCDTGCGVRPELTEKIFERLYQVTRSDGARNGLGLGLYICRELASMMKGRIWVEQSSPEGSTFRFTLPVLSLTHALEPILSQDLQPGNSIALIRVELSSPEEWPSKSEREAASRQAHLLLSGSVLPNLDVILPKMYSDDDSEFLFTVAAADAKGAEVIVERMKSQLGRDELLLRAGVKCSVELRMILIGERRKDQRADEWSAELADSIRKQIEDWAHSKQGGTRA